MNILEQKALQEASNFLIEAENTLEAINYNLDANHEKEIREKLNNAIENLQEGLNWVNALLGE